MLIVIAKPQTIRIVYLGPAFFESAGGVKG